MGLWSYSPFCHEWGYWNWAMTCTVVSNMDRMQLNNSRIQQSHGSIWGPSNQIQPSAFLSRCSIMHVMGFCFAVSTRLCTYCQNQQLLPVSGGSESVIITVSCTAETNMSLSLSTNPGKGCAADLKSWMTCITIARFKLNMGLGIYLFVLKCILHVHCDVNLSSCSLLLHRAFLRFTNY
jgi:hypothetical protein